MTTTTISKIKKAISPDPASFAGSSARTAEFRDRLDDAIDAAYRDGASSELVSLMYEVDHVAQWLEDMRTTDPDYPGCKREFEAAVGDVLSLL